MNNYPDGLENDVNAPYNLKEVSDEEWDYNLHEKAGLTPANMNEDGEQEWIGSDRQWSNYKKLAGK